MTTPPDPSQPGRPMSRAAPAEDAVLPGMPPRLYLASPSRLGAWLDCPRRYRMAYLDRPAPKRREARAHTNLGIAIHSALARWWDLDEDARTPAEGRRLVHEAWIGLGFKDSAHSDEWRTRSGEALLAYLERHGAGLARPVGIERTVSLRTEGMAIQGRIDRLDDRDGQLVVVDYKTGSWVPGEDDARTSLALALYAAAVWKTFRRRCLRVELHHVPSGTVVAHEHTPESLRRKVDEAASIVSDLRRVDAEHRDLGGAATGFTPRPSALCAWCDYRAHCAEGQRMGPEQPSWAGLERRTTQAGAGGPAAATGGVDVVAEDE